MIYITEEQKKFWEDGIKELELLNRFAEKYPREGNIYGNEDREIKITMIKNFIAQSIIIPTRKSWNELDQECGGADKRLLFPNGVIIK